MIFKKLILVGDAPPFCGAGSVLGWFHLQTFFCLVLFCFFLSNQWIWLVGSKNGRCFPAIELEINKEPHSDLFFFFWLLLRRRPSFSTKANPPAAIVFPFRSGVEMEGGFCFRWTIFDVGRRHQTRTHTHANVHTHHRLMGQYWILGR